MIRIFFVAFGLTGISLLPLGNVWAAADTALVPRAAAMTPTLQHPPLVAIATGQVEGQRAGSIAVFKGLPYAAPPVGELRWRAPQPPAKWQGMRRADAFAKACIQPPGPIPGGGGTVGPSSEDCLYLNIWTPAKASTAKLPVMVWIHGGALVVGAGSQPVYDGTAFAQRGAVLVTLNYRLGPLGYFSHPGLDGNRPDALVNFGLADQIAALRWIKDNIAAFGGDPHNVTIFGESAGGQGVLALFASPSARGLFQKGIVQSAYGIPSNSREKARDVGIAQATAAGLSGASATAAELRAVPAQRFAVLKGKDLSLAPGFVSGDSTLPEPILATFQKRRQAKVPLIIGSNSDEGSIAAVFGIDAGTMIARLGAGKILVEALYPGVTSDAQLGREVVRDLIFTAFARRISYLNSQDAPTWRYYFSHLPANLRSKMPGVIHGGEIPLVMGTGASCGCLGVEFTTADRNFSRTVGDYWYTFARSGIPASGTGPAWPGDSVNAPKLMEFGDVAVVRPNFMQERLDIFIGTLNVLGFLLGP